MFSIPQAVQLSFRMVPSGMTVLHKVASLNFPVRSIVFDSASGSGLAPIRPHDFYQPSLNLQLPGFISTNFSDFYEPKVQVWNNVTFADNYYQSVGCVAARYWI